MLKKPKLPPIPEPKVPPKSWFTETKVTLAALAFQSAVGLAKQFKFGIIVSKTLRGLAQTAFFNYIQQNGKIVFAGAGYSGYQDHNGIDNGDILIHEINSKHTAVYTLDGKPIWFKADTSFGDLVVSYFRNSIDFDSLLDKAREQYEIDSKKFRSKFYIRQFIGSVGKTEIYNRYSDETNVISYDLGRYIGKQPFQIIESFKDIDCFEALALNSECEQAIKDIDNFFANKTWFKQHRAAWKRGYFFYGPPGTGKTSFAKAIAKYLSIPVFCFHLGTMTSQEFNSFWDEAQRQTPCIILVEDIDTVYLGRETKVEGGVSFNEFINALDGINGSDGMIFMITSNHPENIDDALKQRPGRIDHAIYMGELDEEGRKKIASRILDFSEDLQEKVVAAGEGLTGAQFQEECIRLALKNFEERKFQNVQNTQKD